MSDTAIATFATSLERMSQGLLAYPDVSAYLSKYTTSARFNTSSADSEMVNLEEDYYAFELTRLESELGTDLYNKLSLFDRDFMIKTAGTIDFGRPVDLQSFAKDIEDYDSTAK